MAKKLSADEITDAIAELEDTTITATVKNILDELEEGWPQDGDPDTWEAGFKAATAVIRNNFRSE
jgi:hypothetical protein